MSPLPRRMLGRAASWENPQVHPYPLPEGLTYVDTAVAIRPFVGSPHQILNSPFRGVDFLKKECMKINGIMRFSAAARAHAPSGLPLPLREAE